MTPQEFAAAWLAAANAKPGVGERVMLLSCFNHDGSFATFALPVDPSCYLGRPYFDARSAENLVYYADSTPPLVGFAMRPPEIGSPCVLAHISETPHYGPAPADAALVCLPPLRRPYEQIFAMRLTTRLLDNTTENIFYSHKVFPDSLILDYPSPNDSSPAANQQRQDNADAYSAWLAPKTAERDAVATQATDVYDANKSNNALAQSMREQVADQAYAVLSGSALPSTMEYQGLGSFFASGPFSSREATRAIGPSESAFVLSNASNETVYTVPDTIDPDKPYTEYHLGYRYTSVVYLQPGGWESVRWLACHNQAVRNPGETTRLVFEYAFSVAGGFDPSTLEFRITSKTADTKTTPADIAAEMERMDQGAATGAIDSIQVYPATDFGRTAYLVRVRFDSPQFNVVDGIGLFCVLVENRVDKRTNLPPENFPPSDYWYRFAPSVSAKTNMMNLSNSQYPLAFELYD